MLLLLCAITTLKAQEPLAQLPSPTQNEIRVAVTDNTLTLSWVATSNTDVENYILGIQGGGAAESVTVDATQAGSHTFMGLQPNTLYEYSVISNGDATRFTNSTATIRRVTTFKEQLDTVKIMLPVEVDQNTLTVAWAAVTNANSYFINVYTGPRVASENVVSEIEITVLKFDLVGDPVTQYTLEIIAQGDRSNFRDSRSTVITVMTAKVVLPTPTENEISVAATTNSITVSWMNVPFNVEEYALDLLRGGVNVDLTRVDVSADGSHTVEGLAPDTPYTVAVVSSADETRYIGSAAYTTRVRTEQLPQLESVVLGNVLVEQSTLTVTWTAVTNATNYIVNIYTGPDAAQGILVTTAQTTELEYVFRGEPVEQYTLEVIARGDSDNFRDSAPTTTPAITQKVVLPIPTESEISVAATTNSITLSWMNVPSDVAKYDLEFSGGDVSADTVQVDVRADSSHTFESLRPNTAYTVAVVSSADETRYIGSAAYTTMVSTEQLPQLESVVLGNGMVDQSTLTVTWTQVTNATNYVVNIYTGPDAAQGILVTTAQTTELEYAFRGEPVEQYTLEVIALGDSDNFRNSVPTTITAMTARVVLPIPTENEISVAATTNSITVSWMNVPSDVEEYALDL